MPTRPIDFAQQLSRMRRDYGVGVQILRDLGLRKLRLLTNHPKHLTALSGFGIEVVEQLFFAKHVDKLSDTEMVVLRDNKGHLDLEISPLP